MRSRFRSESGPRGPREGGNLELVRVRRAQRDTGDAGRELKGRSRRRGGRGRARGRRPEAPPPQKPGFFAWLKSLFGPPVLKGPGTRAAQENKALAEFQEHFRVAFGDADLLKLALTHRSYLSVTGQGPRESNERLEFLGDSVLGLVTSEYLYRENPTEHEGDLTKSKSLLVSKAILSRRALAMGLGRFVLMSHSEVESGGRQRLSILADAFEAVIGAIYLDQGFEPAREFIHKWLLRESGAIVADKRHTNYKSHLQEYVQSTWRTHPVYRIRSEMGPDHSKHFLVEVLVGKRSLGEGRGRNKKEAEQAAARTALERAGVMTPGDDEPIVEAIPAVEPRHEEEPFPVDAGRRLAALEDEDDDRPARRRGRRGGRGRDRERDREDPVVERVVEAAPVERAPEPVPGRLAMPTRRFEPLPESPEPVPAPPEIEPPPSYLDDDEEVGRPEGPFEALHVDPFAWGGPATLEEPELADVPVLDEPPVSDEEESGTEAELTSFREPRSARRDRPRRSERGRGRDRGPREENREDRPRIEEPPTERPEPPIEEPPPPPPATEPEIERVDRAEAAAAPAPGPPPPPAAPQFGRRTRRR